jgi:hypothetical protein
MTDMVRQGGCRCGAVRYEVRGEPHKVGLCHCTDCRSETGSAFLYYADWLGGSFSYKGEVATYEGRSFCPRCGSRLFHLQDDGGAEICVGSLDEAPAGLVPTREGWIKRREHWQSPVAHAYQAKEDPPRSA